MSTMATSAKNFALSPAASDLGLGDMLSQQLQDDLANRKKKALQMKGAQGDLRAALEPSVMGGNALQNLPASSMLFMPPSA
jgi:hypothetical protein